MQNEKHDPWYTTGSKLGVGNAKCTCCGKDLYSDNRAVRMLELDQRTWTYHDDRDVPEDKSQGWFPFGLACAKKMIAKHSDVAAKPAA